MKALVWCGSGIAVYLVVFSPFLLADLLRRLFRRG
jgi:hypothetical protein